MTVGPGFANQSATAFSTGTDALQPDAADPAQRVQSSAVIPTDTQRLKAA
ncbi:MAG: hypothetical protein ACT4OK_02820 [Gemmobacter sp.]